MTAQEAIAYMEDQTWSQSRMGLDRTRALLAALGDPQKDLRFIHVAGSNGKGSTCAMLDAILRAAGYRVGLYTSPHIQNFCERIQVDRKNIPGEHLASIVERIRPIADGMADHPSQFEITTAAAMMYFRACLCDIVVLEVGLGGAMDSTNVIEAPEIAVITNIGLEHTEYLGTTPHEIASAKAGIIKPGCSCVCYDGDCEATGVIKDTCARLRVPFYLAHFSQLHFLDQNLEGQRFTYRHKTYNLALLGQHQLHNAAMVLETVDILRSRGWSLPETAVMDGLRHVSWPARLEVLGRSPLFILDGGHNPQCANTIAESLPGILADKKTVFLMGVLADKDYRAMITPLIPLAQEFICLTPPNERALPAEELAACLRDRGVRARAFQTVEDGLSAAIEAATPDGALVALGSLYMAGAIRSAAQAAPWAERSTGVCQHSVRPR